MTLVELSQPADINVEQPENVMLKPADLLGLWRRLTAS